MRRIVLIPVFVALGALALAAPMDTTPDWIATGDAAGTTFGASVASGDVNGDGYEDLIVGATEPDPSGGWPPPFEASTGKAHVFLGGPAGLAAAPSWTAAGTGVGDLFGSAVAAGDIDGDGFDEVLVGAPRASILKEGNGYIYIYRGGAGGPAGSPSWTIGGEWLVDPYDGVSPWFSQFGSSIAAVPSVNGDAYADILVGAPDYPNWGSRVFAYWGGPSGPTPSPNWTVSNDDLKDADGYFPYNLGYSVAGVGDVNADGFADVLVGAPSFNNLSPIKDLSRAFLFAGGFGGLSTSPSWTATSLTKDFDKLTGFGNSVAGVGDVNGDGNPDFVVGVFFINNYRGQAYVYHGSDQGEWPKTVPNWVGAGPSDTWKFGLSVSGAGDLNTDGYSDIVVATESNRLLAYFGGPTGLSASADWTANGAGSAIAAAGQVSDAAEAGIAVGDGWYKPPSGVPQVGRVMVYYGETPQNRPTGLTQLRLDGTTPIPPGGMTSETGIVAKAALAGAPGDSIKLQMEIRPVGTAFSDSPNVPDSSPVPAGNIASVTASGLADGTAYHWQVRASDLATGKVSSWVAYQTHPDDVNEKDVIVRLSNSAPVVQEAGQYDSLTGRAVPVGDRWYDSGRPELRATATDAEGDEFLVEFEVRPVGVPFSNAATAVSPLRPSGGDAVVTIPAGIGRFHWQYCPVDQYGARGSWTSFGGNPESSPDFELMPGGSRNTTAGCIGSATSGGPALAAFALTIILLALR